MAGATPRSIYDYFAQAVIERHDAGLAPLTLISCDNLSNNGGVLRQRLGAHLDRLSPSHRRWFEEAWTCPATMVDRIVPATTAADLDAVEEMLGMRDEGAVITEPYSQWVIEDRFADDRPRWDLAGATFVDDVAPFETAKLRMLNGAHSALAYLELARGHAFVHQAIADPEIGPLIGHLMCNEAALTIRPSPGQHLDRYADLLLARFRHPALPHRLIQIAADGSQKIGARWLATLADNRAAGRSSPAILQAIAAWVLFVRGDRQSVDDPNAEMMAQAWTRAGSDGVVNALLGPSGIFSEGLVLSNDERVKVRNLLS
nr:mannitol dehydrogenase family protein [uncultured Sphingomonas sp.]